MIHLDIADNVATVTLSRPDALNARSLLFCRELCEAYEEVTGSYESAGSDQARVLLVRSSVAKAFSVGMDLKEARKKEKPDDVGMLSTLPLPTIAAVSGYALGGGMEMALACDLRVASSSSSWALPEVSHGLIPGRGGTQRLARLIGTGAALDLVLTGRRIDGDEAWRLGLVNQVVSEDVLDESAYAIARHLADSDVAAIRAAKVAITRGIGLPLTEGLRLERKLFVDLAQGRLTDE